MFWRLQSMRTKCWGRLTEFKMDIGSIEKTILDRRTKGIPGCASAFALDDISKQGWNILNEDMPLPLMVLNRSNLDYNAELFARYLKAHDLSLAPHGKTTMSPQIFEQQLKHGAWGITAATISQMHVMRAYGIERIILANQLVGKSNIQSVVQELNEYPSFDFFCFIDSIDQLQNMSGYLAGMSQLRPINLLVEIGASGGRTGMRDKSAALSLIDEITKMPDQFSFAGIAAFEGAIPKLEESSKIVEIYCNTVLDIVQNIPPPIYEGQKEFILTGGGSAYFDMIVEKFSTLSLSIPVRVVLRSGCYITNDHGAYSQAQELARVNPERHWTQKFRPALEVWSYVQSIPEPGLAFLTMGKRDMPYDAGLPIPIKRYRPGKGFLKVGMAEIFNTNDQHAYVRIPHDTDWQVGDMISSGISHPCTAFDKWQFIPIVDENYNVVDGLLT